MTDETRSGATRPEQVERNPDDLCAREGCGHLRGNHVAVPGTSCANLIDGFNACPCPAFLEPAPTPATEATRREMKPPKQDRKLVLHIEVPDFFVSSEDEKNINEFCEGDVLFVCLEEWMRPEVGLTMVSRPGEKSLNSEFEVHAFTAEIVGAELRHA